MDFNIKDNLVTYITKDGKIVSIGKNLNEGRNDALISILNKYGTNLNEYSNTLEIYKEIAKLGLLTFLNSGKEIINGEEKYSFAILCPDNLTLEQQKYLSMYTKDNYVNHTLLFKYDKEKEKIENMMYEQKLSYGIDEIKELLKSTKDMSELITDTFYNDIVPSIITGRTIIDDITYHVNYNVMLDNKLLGNSNPDIPVLTIKNIDEFNKYLTIYIEKQLKFLSDNKFTSISDIKERIRYCLMNLFINATSYDFNNPIDFLKLRISFLDNEMIKNNFLEYKNIYEFDDINCHIESMVLEQHPANETPYAFCSKVVNNDTNESYDLPKIRYGIKDEGIEKTVYIYGIQGSKKKSILTNFEKKMNRYLFKVNKDVCKDDEYLEYEEKLDDFYPENVVDVTPKSVFALTIFLKVIKELNINKVICVPYLPIRYYGNLKGKNAVLDLSKNFYSEDIMLKKRLDIEQNFDDNQSNITDKFIRTFNRVNYHLNNMSNIIYPYELDDFMHFNINDNISDNDHMINKVYNNITINNVKRK